MARYFLYIEYVGTPFAGWQKQPDALTVQGELERCIKLVTRQDCLVYGSGRTDAGVHASHQVAHVDLDEVIDLQKFAYRLNSILHQQIKVWEIKAVHSEAHARFDAISRAYSYKIVTKPSPLRASNAWIMNSDLDFNLMKEAASYIPKISSFKPFSKDNPTNIGSEFCKVEIAFWESQQESEYVFSIKSDRFLHHMVRYLVGSMFKVGTQTLSLETFKNALEGNESNFVHLKAPAHGLCLTEVNYPDSCFI